MNQEAQALADEIKRTAVHYASSAAVGEPTFDIAVGMEKLIDRLAAMAQPQWQPIDTAPKDGTLIVGVVDHRVRLIGWGKTSHVPMYGWCLADQGAEDFDLCDPTHWMPLPAAPKPETSRCDSDLFDQSNART